MKTTRSKQFESESEVRTPPAQQNIGHQLTVIKKKRHIYITNEEEASIRERKETIWGRGEQGRY